MSNTQRLGKSGIEYLDYVWNFYSGCLHKKMGVCPVDNCWAEDIVNRFGGNYPNGFEPTYYPEAFLSPLYLKKPSIIGCAFMGDLFGDWVDPNKNVHSIMPSGKASIAMSLKGWIFTTIRQCPQHRFLFLTKNPNRLISWGKFPDNCWVGVSATNHLQAKKGTGYLRAMQAKIKFMSFEPLLMDIGFNDTRWAEATRIIKSLDWVIIGSQTKPYKPPEKVWVDEITGVCKEAGIPYFLKDNLHPLMGKDLVQDMPKGVDLDH